MAAPEVPFEFASRPLCRMPLHLPRRPRTSPAWQPLRGSVPPPTQTTEGEMRILNPFWYSCTSSADHAWGCQMGQHCCLWDTVSQAAPSNPLSCSIELCDVLDVMACGQLVSADCSSRRRKLKVKIARLCTWPYCFPKAEFWRVWWGKKMHVLDVGKTALATLNVF